MKVRYPVSENSEEDSDGFTEQGKCSSGRYAMPNNLVRLGWNRQCDE